MNQRLVSSACVGVLGARGAALSILALGASTALGAGAPFQINTIDAGGIPGGSLGNPITWTGGAAFNPATGGNFPPAQQAIAGNAAIGWDSYLAIDPRGRSFGNLKPFNPVEGYTALGPTSIIYPTATPTTPFSASSLSGVWFNAGAGGGFVTSGSNENIMFIAQITLRAGSSVPTTDGVLVNIRDFGTVSTTGELGALKFGAQNATNNSGKWGQAYFLDLRVTPTTGLVGAFANATSYEVLVRAVPGPGAAGAMMLVGVAAARRRR
ncbi:MAG: hypothetical protein ACKVZJ_10545 [Phycisphaerales bacterium]